MPTRRVVPRNNRATYARTNHANGGFKDNTPGAWVDTSGPVWWYGSDRAYLQPSGQMAGRSAITRATNVIIGPVTTAPWTVGDGAAPRWVSDPMLTRPDARVLDSPMWPATLRLPRSGFWGTWVRSALMWGMGYLIFKEDTASMPLAGSLAVIRPDRVEPDPESWRGDLTHRRRIMLGSYEYVDTDYDGRFTFAGTRFRLVELRNPTTPCDPQTGVTPGTLTFHAAELGLIDAQLQYASGTYGGSGVPSGYLKVNGPVTSDQADDIKTGWMAAHGSGQRSVAVLSSLVDYSAIAVSPVDAALADTMRLSLTAVANMFGVPGYMIGAPGVSMTYSNVEMEVQALYEFTLKTWATAIEETLSALLPAGIDLNIEVTGERRQTNAGPAGPADSGAGSAGDVPPGGGLRGQPGPERPGDDPGPGGAVRQVDRTIRWAGGVLRADSVPQNRSKPGEGVPEPRQPAYR